MTQILDNYLEYNSGNECALQYHRWAFLSCAATCLGRRVVFPFGNDDLFPTMYVAFVGLPASRKSTAINLVKKLMKISGYNKFAYEKTTREKFLLDFEEGFENGPNGELLDISKALEIDRDISNQARVSECFICVDEMIDFLGMRNINFLNLFTTLWDNKPNYPERLKNSVSVNIMNPTINALCGFTPTTLNMAIPPEMIGQGFTSRFILVYASRTGKRITFPKKLTIPQETEIVECFQRLQKVAGTVEFSEPARDLLDEIYQNYIDIPDSRFAHYCSRRLTHLFKLCMVFAALRETLIVTDDIVEQANTVLAYTENSMTHAIGEFGSNRSAVGAQKIMEVLHNADRPMSIPDIWQAVNQDVEKASILSEILEGLKLANKIIMNSPGQFATNKETVVMLNKNIFKQNTIGIDYERWIIEERVK